MGRIATEILDAPGHLAPSYRPWSSHASLRKAAKGKPTLHHLLSHRRSHGPHTRTRLRIFPRPVAVSPPMSARTAESNLASDDHVAHAIGIVPAISANPVACGAHVACSAPWCCPPLLPHAPRMALPPRPPELPVSPLFAAAARMPVMPLLLAPLLLPLLPLTPPLVKPALPLRPSPQHLMLQFWPTMTVRATPVSVDIATAPAVILSPAVNSSPAAVGIGAAAIASSPPVGSISPVSGAAPVVAAFGAAAPADVRAPPVSDVTQADCATAPDVAVPIGPVAFASEFRSTIETKSAAPDAATLAVPEVCATPASAVAIAPVVISSPAVNSPPAAGGIGATAIASFPPAGSVSPTFGAVPVVTAFGAVALPEVCVPPASDVTQAVCATAPDAAAPAVAFVPAAGAAPVYVPGAAAIASSPPVGSISPVSGAAPVVAAFGAAAPADVRAPPVPDVTQADCATAPDVAVPIGPVALASEFRSTIETKSAAPDAATLAVPEVCATPASAVAIAPVVISSPAVNSPPAAGGIGATAIASFPPAGSVSPTFGAVPVVTAFGAVALPEVCAPPASDAVYVPAATIPAVANGAVAPSASPAVSVPLPAARTGTISTRICVTLPHLPPAQHTPLKYSPDDLRALRPTSDRAKADAALSFLCNKRHPVPRNEAPPRTGSPATTPRASSVPFGSINISFPTPACSSRGSRKASGATLS